MPFKDPGRKREYMREWRATNRHRVEEYHRTALLNAALRKNRFPTARSVTRYALTEEELQRVLSSVVRSAQLHDVCVSKK